jgi:hypothetical protein
MQKLKKILKQFYLKIGFTGLIFGLVLFFGIFLRVYQVDDWYMFKADQSRDFSYLREAYKKGPLHLNLLGPKVDVAYLEGDSNLRGEPFRLGPIYYYIQYVVAKIVGSINPWIMTVPDLIFSILAIPLFYYFTRLYFRKNISLILTGIFSVSYYLVQYARFSWNPNPLIFWELVFLISIYKTALVGNIKSRGWWLVSSFFSLAVLSQLHILAALGFPIIGIIFWFFYRPKQINWKYWVGAIGIVLFLYLPVFVSDIKNNGDNIKRFFVIVTRENGEEMSLTKRLEKTTNRFGEFSSILLTSFHQREIKKIEKNGTYFFFLTLFLVMLSITKKIWKKKINIKLIPPNKPFLVLIGIWTLVYLILFSRIVDDLNRARYFLVIAPVPLIFLGYWLKILMKLPYKKTIAGFIFLTIAFCVVGNLSAIYYWFGSIQAERKLDFRSPKVGYHDDYITLSHLEKALSYMNQKTKNTSKDICFFIPDYQYKNSLYYLQEENYPDKKMQWFNWQNRYEGCEFFVITRSKDDRKEVAEEFFEFFKLKEKKDLGLLLVWNLEYLKNESVNNLPLLKERKVRENDEEKKIRIWQEVFEGK